MEGNLPYYSAAAYQAHIEAMEINYSLRYCSPTNPWHGWEHEKILHCPLVSLWGHLEPGRPSGVADGGSVTSFMM
ncbi:hypothetical protein N7517_011073 [Penicillium concentricum]|uniref:Uncharacterized protein n=1 Tax=Penicillium concentricum TaxID=293559 RepID=A0A9W9RCP1_9EURO|nr:uncharacterized protein N7517_011073 [Penicillium concentricum]KAJ5356464.1 hypothetical protein N7517_011073 [Penicillium concentricum]